MKSHQPQLKPTVVILAIAISIGLFAGCGGGGGTSSTALPPAAAAAAPANSWPVAQAAPPDTSQPSLSLPGTIANGSVLELQCGRLYLGTLDLRNKSNVTVRTAGSCGKAAISPGQPVGGWTRHQGSIYSAALPFDAAQVLIDGAPIEAAHWPNRPQTWARAAGSTATGLNYAMPNADLTGATLVFRPYEWAIEARTITSYAGSSMTLAATGNPAYDGYALGGAVDFYVEGKLWMLDQPGEWAMSGGRLYVWSPDGASPEGRVWAAPDRHAVDASDSRSVTIENVRLYAAANGVNAPGALDLRVADADIANLSENGIVNSGGARLAVERSSIRNARHDAITVHWGGGGERITDSSIDGAGTLGMPANARAAINLTAADGSTVSGNRVANAGYIGVRVFRNATVSGNTISGACFVLTDCGGVFTSARDRLALNTRISANRIDNVGRGQRLAWGIYLGDYANAVTVDGNVIADNGNGMQLFNGYGVTVSGNTFSGSGQSHVQIMEAGAAAVVRNNTFSGNTFNARGGEENYRISSDLGAGSVAQFGSYSANSYLGAPAVFANFNGEALSFAQWQARTGQDGASTQAP